ncbi:MAG: chemotaxis protein CheD [Thermodesulfobacteriota bacterium]
MKPEPEILPKNNDLADWVNVYLKQGEFYISGGSPVQVRTVLGSCVTVTMYCPVRNIGGITHSLLPYPLPNTVDAPNLTGRYVNLSIRHVFSRMAVLGVNVKTLEVKIFGGGQMFLPVPGKPVQEALNIGRRNVETALKTIQELGLNITATDVGGNHGRKLLFFPHRGDVWIKKINRTVNQKTEGHD